MNQHASINRAYRLIWNQARRAWIPVAENMRARGKRSVRATLRLAPLLSALALGQPALAAGPPPAPTQLPTGGQVVAGAATLSSGGTARSPVLDVNQSSSRAVIDWSTFNVGSAAEVDFKQPNASSATLNRVLDSNPSQIFGKIEAPGQVFLANPNGVYFGKSASVDVGSLTATTGSISNADFMAGNIKISRDGATGGVINDGTLKASLGGYIALLAPDVRNSGVVVAQMGTVVMAAGDAITLSFNDGHLTGVTAQPSTIKSLIENRSAVMAPGGLIILSAKALDSLEGGVIENSGTLAATGMVSKGGRILLEASSSITNSGTISASAGADGGPAGSVSLTAPSVVNTGTIAATAAVAPAIQEEASAAASGGQVSISATNIEQSGSGSIDVSGPIAGDVQLQALRDINVSGSILAVGISEAASSSASPSIGGQIALASLQDVTLQNVTIDVSGGEAAGSIAVRGGSPAPSEPPGSPPVLDVLGNSEIDASSRRGKGGSVTLSASQVNLLDTVAIDASGAAGGGNVFVGGGFRGSDPSVPNALQTTVASGATINASATQDGEGGEVVIWSEQHTAFAGSILARGGPQGGAGGTLEVSGAQLDYSGTVDAGAPRGQGGSLLLDPKNLTVDSSGTDSLSNETFSTNPSTDSTIAPSAITAVTDTGTAVTLQANNNLTINSSIVTSAGGAGGAMTFEAGNSIAVNASVISDNGNISFTANDSGATAADRASGTATFANNSVIDAGSGTVAITMGSFSGTGAASGTVETGHVVAASLNVTQDGPTTGAAAGAIDLGETDLTGNLSITANSDRNVTNTLGAQGTGGEVVVRGTATISVGAGYVTINGPDTDFNVIGLTAGNVTLNDASAVQFATSTISGNLIETTIGPIASVGPVQVTGTTSLTANNGGFGYADPYINLTNASNHFTGTVALDVGSTGATGTGGYATIRDSGAIDIATATLASSLTVQAGGAVALGTTSVGSTLSVNTSSGGITTGTTSDTYETLTATGAVSLGASTIGEDLTISTNAPVTNTGAITVARQTTVTAGSGNDITLDNAGNKFDYMRVVTGDNVTLVDVNGINFGNYAAAGGWTSHVYGNLSLTAGGDINQVGSSNGNGGYSAIEVDGATTFTANNASSPINLYLGTSNPWGALGQPNNLAGAVTLARNNTNTGFSNVEIRNTNAGASVLTGLTSVGTLSNVILTYDNAPSVSLPGMTVSNELYVYAPSVANTSSTPANVISQTGAISVGNAATFETATTGDIDLGNASNSFQKYFGVVQADNVTVDNSGGIVLYASPGYDEHIYGNLTVTAGGNITDAGNRIWVTAGTASFNAGSANVSLTQDNVWSTVAFPDAGSVTLNSNRSLVIGTTTISGSLYLHCDNGNNTLTQESATSIDMTTPTATATFSNWSNGNGVSLTSAQNVLGPIAISGDGALNITENDAITQASAWGDTDAVTLTTSNDQAITLSQSGNDLGALTITQQNSGATSAGAVDIVNTGNATIGLAQGGAWTVAGTLTLNSGSHSIDLNNANNVLGPLQVLASSGTTNSQASSVIIHAKNGSGTDAITDVGGTGAWSTGTNEVVELVAYDSAGTTEGGGNVTLENAGNVLGELYIKADNVTITENNSIVDGPVLSNWDGANDSGWATTGSMNLVVANPTGKSIDLSNLDNLIGPIALSTTGTAGTLSSVLVTDNEDLTQNGAWVVGGAPVTLDARTHGITLTNAANVLGNITITTADGTPTSVAITEDDNITQGSAWVLTGVPVTLVAENGNGITLTNGSNILGNLTVTGGVVSITENGTITQGGAWTTTGITTLDPTAAAITLTNANNQLGPIAIGGTPSAVSITESADITQASAWVDPSTPFTLASGTHDILLTQPSNELGNLILTGQNASVTESDPAGITEAGAWSVPGTTTLTAGTANPIVLTAEPSNSLGTVSVVSASTADIWTAGGVIIGTSTVSTGDLEIDAGGPITQSGVITALQLLLVGTGDATLTNPGNSVGTLAAGFSGGDLAFTNSGNLAIGVIGGTTGVTIGGHNVTLTSVNGTVTGLTDVNGSSSSLTVDAGTGLSLPQLAIAGPQTYTATSGITLGAGLTSTASGAITFNSPVTLAADLTVQSTNSAITFESTVTGAGYQLNVNAGSGLADFNGAVSGLGATTDASAALTLASGGANFATTLSANNGLAVTGPVTFNDAVTLADGSAASVFTGLVTLGKAGGMSLSGYNGMSFDGGVLLRNGPATIDSNDSPLVFQTAGSVSGAYGLTLDSGTASITGLGRMGNDLTSLTVTALSPTIPAAGISIAGPQTYTATSGSNITLDGNATSTAGGAITFNGPVVLGTAVTVASSNSPVVFGATVDGNQNLAVNAGTGTTEFSGAVGAITAVGSGTGAAIALEGTGTTTFASSLQTRSGITAVGPVVFDGDVTLGNGDTASVFSGGVTAGGSSGGTLSGYRGMAFNGGLTLSGGPVAIDSNGGTIALGGPVTGPESLTLDALAGGAGTVTGLNQIGPASDLTALNVTGQTLSLPSTGLAVAGPMTFTAAGGITLNGAVGSAASPASGAVTFDGPVTLATGPVSVATANAPVVFNSSVEGAQTLGVDAGTGTTTFAANVGDTTPITSLQIGSGGTTVLDGASVHTSGAQTYGGPVSLGADVALSGDNIKLSSTLDGAHALTITDSGTTTLGGIVGGSKPLVSLSIGATGIAVNATSVTTTGAQTYDGAVTLGTDATFSGNGIDFGSTVDGAHALTANAGPGVLTFNGAVGGSAPLASLSATGQQLSAGNVSTAGAQAYTAVAGVSLDGALTTSGGGVTVTGPTTLTGDTRVATSGGNIDFSGSASTINGDHALTLTGGNGNVLLGGVVGGAAPLSAITDSGYDLTLPDVTTVGDANQSYTALDNITLTQSRTLNAPVSFTADADGNGAGSFILQTGVSLTASNNSLSITAADLDLQGNSTLSSGTGVTTITATDGRNIYLGGSTTAPGQLTITGDELSRMSSSGGLVLNTTGSGWIDVNGITAQQSQNITGTLDLEARGTGAIGFISAASTFSAVKADAAGGATNVGVNLTTVGHSAEFVTPVTISGASTIASGGGNIKFDSGVSVANDLTLITGNGTLTFSGSVGSTSTLTLSLGGGSVSGLSELQPSLTGLMVIGTAAISLPAITINGPQVYDTGAITLTGDLAGTGITFNSSLVTAAPSSGSSLALNARTGTLAFNCITNFQAVDMTLTADNIGFGQPVAGTGNLVIEPYTASADVAIGGSGSPISGLNVTAADLSKLPLADLASLTIGAGSDTGTIDMAGALDVSGTPLTLNGGGGITQSGGAITSGALTLNVAGHAIDLPNSANAFGAVAIGGTPTAVTLASSREISQQGTAAWALGSAPVTLDAGTADIALANAGNTFGTLDLTGGNATVNEAAATDLGASSLSGNLAVTSTGGIAFSGALAAHGNVSLSAAGEITQSAALSIGGNLDAATTLGAGDVTINNSGAASTTIGNSEVGGNYSLTATGEPVTQAAGSAIQVVGNLTVTAGNVDLSGAANLIGGTTSLPASNTTVIERPGVINLASGTYSGNLTVISQRTSRSFGSSEVNGNAIVLDDSSNDIGGTISVSASAPTIVTGSDVQTGITQQAGTSLSVTGLAAFTAEDSTAGSLGIELSNGSNVFGTLQVTGTTVTVDNSATATTTLANSEATTSLAITAAGAVAQTGAINTPALTVNASGAITLDNTGNQIGTLSATSSGKAISVADGSGLSVTGIDSGGAAVSLTAGGGGNLTQTGAIANVTSLTADADGGVTLNNSGNTIQSLAASSAGTGFQLYDSSALSVLGAAGSAAGDVVVRAAGDVTLQSGGSLTAHTGNLVVSTEGNGNFINDSTLAGAALAVGAGDRWLVYSDTPDLVSGAHTVKGGLTSNFRSYGATYATYAPASVTQRGDGFIYDYAKPSLLVNAAISGSPTQVYGDDPTGTLTYTIVSGLVDSEDSASNVITGGTATYSMALSNSLDAGTYTIQYSGGLTSNYTLQADPTGVSYTVTPAVLSYVATAASRTYGAANPVLTGTVTGFKLGQSAATVLTGTPAWSTAATAGSPVAQYAIDGSGYTPNGNYTLAQAAGNATALSVTPATLTVTASNDTVSYDGVGFSGGAGVTYSGFVNGEGASVLGGTLAYGGNSQGARNAGTYSIAPSGLTSGNYAITYDSGTLTINKASLEITTSDVTKAYDGTLAATGTPITTGGTSLYGTDALSGGTYAFTNANAGSGDRTVTVNGVTVNDGNGGGNYAVTYVDNTQSTIDPASITVSTANVTKTYDGTDSAAGTLSVVSGTLYQNASNHGAEDSLSGGTFAFTDPNAGTGNKAVAVSGVTVSDGNGGGNYHVTYTDNTTSTIDPAPLTFRGTVAEKTYDGTTAASISGYSLNGLVGSQTLGVTVGAASFADPNASAGKSVAISGIALTDGTNGGLASNYTVSPTSAATGTIDPKTLTVNVAVASKVYDGTTAAVVESYGLSGFVGNETVNAVYTGSASFGDKNVGDGKQVSVTGIELVNGTHGGLATNYAVPATVTASADITPATLHIAGVVAENKVYDGTKTAYLNTQSAVLTGIIGSDSVGVSALTGTFATKDVGTNIPIGTGTVVLSGADAGNYTLVQPSGLSANITQAPLTVTASNDTVSYDGAGFSGGAGVAYSGFVNGEDASVLGGTLAYGGSSQGARNVGMYSIVPSGLTSGNYAITYGSGTLTIDRASLEITTSDVTKTYDGTLIATGTPVATGGTSLYGTDSLSGGAYAFTNANAGSGDRSVTVSGVTVNDGNGGGNYAVTYVDNTQSTIKPASITVSTANVTKTYDGTDSAAGTLSVVSGTLYQNASNGGAQDSLSGGTFAFTDPNAGTGNKAVAVSGVTVSDGNGGGNYDVTYADNTTSTIDPAPLTFSGTVAEKTYDGTTAASLSGYSLNGLVGSQTLGATIGAASFADPNAGAGKSVAISGIALTDGTNGGLASNYTVSPTSAATGTIDPKMLTVDAAVASKVYDGTTAAVVESYGLSGFVGNQTVAAVSTGSASFDNKNVGNGKQVSVTGIELVNGTNGGLAANYAVPATATASADITPATLHLAGVVAEGKVYDGTTTANLNTQSAVLTGVIGSDSVSVSALTGTFATKDVGTNIPIGTGTVVLSGTDAGNYTLVQPSGLSADITPRPLTVTATGFNKVYDGTTAALVTLSDNVLPGDSVAVSSTNAFLGPNAGTGKYISVSDISLSGTDAQDYVANTSTSAYATVMPATLTITATGENKLYDGSAAAQVTLSDDALPGDQVTLGDGGATFDSPDVGNGKTVTVDGIYISGGANASDYIVGNTSATTTADITGSVSPPPPPPPSSASASAAAGKGSLPPAIPAPQPPVVPTAPAPVLDASLPANFGTSNEVASGSTAGSGTAEGGSVESPLASDGVNTGSVAGVASGPSGSGQPTVAGATGSSSGAAGSGAGANTGGGTSAGGGTSTSGPDVSVSLMVAAKPPLQGLIVVSVPQTVIEHRDDLRVSLPEAVVEAITAPVRVTSLEGGKLPPWLRYEPLTHSFIGTGVPAGALPYKARVQSGDRSWVVLITERFGS